MIGQLKSVSIRSDEITMECWCGQVVRASESENGLCPGCRLKEALTRHDRPVPEMVMDGADGMDPVDGGRK